MSTSRLVFTVVGKAITQMFEAEERRMQMVINDLVSRNDEKSFWFLYQGKVYQSSTSTLVASGNKGFPQLSLSLIREMDEYVRERKEIESDQAQIRQILISRLQSCQTLQEIRDTLPRCVVPLISELADLEPRFEEGCFAPKHERFVAQYEKLLPKIAFYCGTRLLY